MTRVITVVYDVHPVPALFLVMLFADAVVIAVMGLAPMPVIDIMGGVRGTAREALLAAVAFNVSVLAILSAPVWILGALISLVGFRPMWPIASHPKPERSRGLLIVASASIVAFAPLLVWAQPEQALRHRVERQLLSGRISDGLAVMSAHEYADFPPDYNPPPRLGYRETKPSMDDVRAAMRENWPAEWVAQAYLHKTRRQIGTRFYINPADEAAAEYFDRNLGDGWMFELAREHRDALQFLVDFDASIPEATRSAIQRFIEAAELAAPDQESSASGSNGPT